jgi:hypothetical protein
MNKDEGVIYHDEDRGKGPFMLRQGGTSNFVTSIRTNYYSRWGSPGEEVIFAKGWSNPAALSYQTMDEAIKAASEAYRIEGSYISIEAQNS